MAHVQHSPPIPRTPSRRSSTAEMGPPLHTPVTSKRSRTEEVIDLEAETQECNLLTDSFPAKLVHWTKDSTILILKDKELERFTQFLRGITEVDENQHTQLETLHTELQKLFDVNAELLEQVGGLTDQNIILTNIAAKLSTRVEDDHMDVRPTLTDIGLQTTTERITNTDVQRTVAELMEIHEDFKDKLFQNLRKYSETQLKENTRTRTEYNAFRDMRKELNKWFISCQLIKKNLANEQNSSSYHYLKADLSYSPAVVDDHVFKQVKDDLQQSLEQADLHLKLASVEHNIHKVDKLNKLLADSNNSLIFAKAFKGVLKVHKNLGDRTLFKPRRLPRNPIQRPRNETRKNTDKDDLPARHTERFRNDFPPLYRESETELDEDVFEDQTRRPHQYEPRVFRRNNHVAYRQRRDKYEPEISFRNDHRRDSEWSAYEHYDDHRYTNRDDRQHYGRHRNSELRPSRDYETDRKTYCY